ncbi:LysR substrate-binding domain-containing protein [Devosia psychrophila]
MLKNLQTKVAMLRGSDDDSVLRLSTTHSLAMKWLAPRLHRFGQRYPELDLRVEANDAMVSTDGHACDIALRYTNAPADNLLFRDSLVVVVSPEVGAASLDEALEQPLLYEGTLELWLRFLGQNGRRNPGYDFSRSFSHAGLLVQAAVAGHGVALAPYALAYEDLSQGRLVTCPCIPLASHYGYRLVFDERKLDTLKIRAFVDWIEAETADMAQAFATAFPESTQTRSRGKALPLR